ncbi:hypothetical protein H4582DRAFT_1585767 [Lactarius indigo]|nr:hypothetical protein H4582DRAFT_1585767 [Lactarius indigo]
MHYKSSRVRHLYCASALGHSTSIPPRRNLTKAGHYRLRCFCRPLGQKDEGMARCGKGHDHRGVHRESGWNVRASSGIPGRDRLSLMLSHRFRWVFCQLEVLRHCFPSNVRQALEGLPESLDETYERILKGINKANRRHAHRLLQCLAAPARSLRGGCRCPCSQF